MARTPFARLAAPLALVLALGGCALRSPSIADIKYNPGRYQDRTVSVEGVVTSSWGVPLVPFKLYKIDDGTGEVTVVAQMEERRPKARACGEGTRERRRHLRRSVRRPAHRAGDTTSSGADEKEVGGRGRR